MLHVGIDPGTSWCGFAALDFTSDGTIRVEARTYDVAAHGGYLGMARDILDLLPHARRAHIAVEDFRIRGAGHQRANHGDTLRFIGALEFGIEAIDLFSISFIPPSNNGVKESDKLFGRVLSRYRKRWPRSRAPAWQHCSSAWRVLGHHLLKDHESRLAEINTTIRTSTKCFQWLPSLSRKPDYIADAAIWR